MLNIIKKASDELKEVVRRIMMDLKETEITQDKETSVKAYKFYLAQEVSSSQKASLMRLQIKNSPMILKEQLEAIRCQFVDAIINEYSFDEIHMYKLIEHYNLDEENSIKSFKAIITMQMESE